MSHLFQRTRGRQARRGFAIHGYVGPNGSGKSAAMIWDTLPSLDAGRPVLSTVRLLDWRNPRPCDDPACSSPDHATHLAAHPLWIPWTKWSQLLDFDYGDVLADEITGVAGSRESAGLPAQIQTALQQLRRDDVLFRFSGPAWSRADKILRECAQGVTVCTGYFPVKVFDDDGTERMWRRRRLFRWHTYDAQMLTAFDASQTETATSLNPQAKKQRVLKPVVRDLFWGPGSEVFSAYDTFDSILMLGSANSSGTCVFCEGRRTRHVCACDDYADRRRARRSPAGPRRGAGDDGSDDGGDGFTAQDGAGAALAMAGVLDTLTEHAHQGH